MKKLIFTDLDGTLLDGDYSYEEAKLALELIEEKEIPLIICTSKTRAEIENYRRKLENKEPFISENGGAIFIPKNYFSFSIKGKVRGGYKIIEFGTHYEDLVLIMQGIDEKYGTTSFYELSAIELAKETDMSMEDAKRAKNREYDIVFRIDDEKNKKKILKTIEEKGLNYTEGDNYYHVMGNNDKGKAVRKLIELYKKEFGDIETIGLGDADNDKPMLKQVDKDFMINGPKEWNEIILRELD